MGFVCILNIVGPLKSRDLATPRLMVLTSSWQRLFLWPVGEPLGLPSLEAQQGWLGVSKISDNSDGLESQKMLEGSTVQVLNICMDLCPLCLGPCEFRAPYPSIKELTKSQADIEAYLFNPRTREASL